MFKKRIRGSNFNGKEEDILIQCVLRHLSVIENKKTDAPTLREKQRAWEEIGNEFNSLCPDVARHTKALKDKYTNIKTMLRKQFAADRTSRDGKECEEWRPDWRQCQKSEAMSELVKFLSSSLLQNKSPNLDYTHGLKAYDNEDYDNEDYDYESHDAVLPSVESDDDDEKPFDSINIETIEFPHHDNSNSVKNVTMDNIFPTNLSQSSVYAPVVQRKRGSNFNIEEENTLVKCVLRHASIVENKKIDTAVLRQKQRAWEEIGNEFNALCPNVARQTKALKDKYTNLKTMLRKQFEAEKVKRKATNGGMEMPEWRPKSDSMAELAKLLSFSFNASSPAIEYDEDEDDYDYESHDAVLPSVESFAVESDDGERPFDSNNLQTIKLLHNDNSDNSKNNNIFPTTLSQPSMNKSNRTLLRQIPSAASSSDNDMEASLQSLKKNLIKRTLEMREIEHKTRLTQHQREHEARLALLEAQKMDFDSKVKLRQLKIAKLSNEKRIKTEVNSEET